MSQPTGPRTLEIFAVAAPGIEPLVAGELATLGVRAEVATGGARWTGTVDELYRTNLHLRTASRVLLRLARFRARSFIELERHARRIDWSPYLNPEGRVRLRVTSRKSKLYHQGAIEERFVRFISEASGAHPVGSAGQEDETEDEEEPDDGQLLIVRFSRDECTVSVDSSGELLHRRGYRQAVTRAPLRETIAAAILLGGGWAPGAPLLDPLCGSGTIPIEAALIARAVPPGLASASREPRAFAFRRWPSFDPTAWDRVVEHARAGIRADAGAAIRGSDRDDGAIEAASANAARAGVETDVAFSVASLSAGAEAAAGQDGPGWLVTNPPYGVRVGDARPLRDLYATLGNLLHRPLAGWNAALLVADDSLAAGTGIPLHERFRTSNGGIPVRLLSTTPAPLPGGAG